MIAVLHFKLSPGRRLLEILLAFACLLFALPVQAHELEMDTLSIRLKSESREIEGQFMLNSKLTRPDEGPKDFAVEKSRALRFASEHVTLAVGTEKIPLALELRELHERGGAVPGDSIVFTGMLPPGQTALSVSIRAPLERIAVTVSLDAQESQTVIVTGREPVIVSTDTSPAGTGATGFASTSTRAPSPSPATSRKISPPTTSFRQFLDYIWTGIIHIVPFGWDHILFVVALTLGSLGWNERRYRRLVLELTAFTLAHTLTLALGALDVVKISANVVEPLIAFSIFAVAAEHLLSLKNRGTRAALIGFFGLVHGLGFAGGLRELGLSGPSFLVFLASFNLGVELGQLAVVLLTLSLIWLIVHSIKQPDLIFKSATLAIALTGLTVGVTRLL